MTTVADGIKSMNCRMVVLPAIVLSDTPKAKGSWIIAIEGNIKLDLLAELPVPSTGRCFMGYVSIKHDDLECV